MAAAAKENTTPITGEYVKLDAGKAFRIFDQEIQPKMDKMAEKRGETKEPWDRIKDQCNFPKRTLTFLIKLRDMEDAERDHHLLAMHEGMKHLKLFMPSDLVTQAQGQEPNASIIPMGERPKPKLATLNARVVQEGDGVDADLADAGDVVIPLGGTSDDEQAISAAIQDAIADGALSGISEPDAPDDGSNISGMDAPEAQPDDGMMIVSVKGHERRVHYSSKVQPKGMSEGQIWRDEKSETFWVMTNNGLRSYAFAEDAE